MSESRLKPDVMLLAAGLGTRLRPFTDTVPKPLVAVAGKPLFDHVLEQAIAAGLDRFVVNAHHHAGQIVDHVDALAQRYPRARFTVSREEGAILGTGGGVKNALPLLGTDPILVMNTDAFWVGGAGQPLLRLIERYGRGDVDKVLLCVHPRDARGFRRSHDFCLDPGGRITRDVGAPVIYAGVCLIGRHLFDDAPEPPFSLSLLFDPTRDPGSLAGVVLDHRWLHVGDPAAHADAESILKASA